MPDRHKLLTAGTVALAAVLLAVPVRAQTQGSTPPEGPQPQTVTKSPALPGHPLRPAGPDYSKGFGHFPNPIKPYMPHHVEKPTFTNTDRLQNAIQNGTLVLSLNDAIAMALENNLDLAIARYNLSIADTDVLLAKSGSSIRGVSTGLVQGTPGGGVGGFGSGASGAGAGGTTAGAGGVGAGSSGLVQSTLGAGSAVEQFDPTLTGTLQVEHAVFPLTNTITTGVSTLNQNTSTANFTYNQGFATGTALQVGFNNQRQTTNSLFSTLNPSLQSNFRATLRQHLLQGFGFNNQLRFIHIAKNNRLISDSAFRQQVVTTVSQIQNIYWDLVNAYEDVKVKERSLALANKTLSDNKKQVEIGTLAPIEIVRAESEVAARNQDLIVSRTNLQLQQTLMKNAISRNISDPTLTSIPVIPSDTMVLPTTETFPAVEELIQTALQRRPEIVQSSIDLKNRDISKNAAKNALLPSLDLFAFYGATGLAGDQNALSTCGINTSANCIPAGTIGNTGFGTAFGNLFDSSAPDKGVGISLTIPLRNRSAQAVQIRSELEYRQAQLRVQQLENTINIEVRNAEFALQQNRARVEAAIKGRELAQQSLDAEQKKYSLGASTNFQVLQAQRDLAQAESSVVQAMSAYEKSRVEVQRVTGTTLEANNIDLDQAAVGKVQVLPTVPNVAPNPEAAQPKTQTQPK